MNEVDRTAVDVLVEMRSCLDEIERQAALLGEELDVLAQRMVPNEEVRERVERADAQVRRLRDAVREVEADYAGQEAAYGPLNPNMQRVRERVLAALAETEGQ